jgi:hypothetical protein
VANLCTRVHPPPCEGQGPRRLVLDDLGLLGLDQGHDLTHRIAGDGVVLPVHLLPLVFNREVGVAGGCPFVQTPRGAGEGGEVVGSEDVVHCIYYDAPLGQTFKKKVKLFFRDLSLHTYGLGP